LDTVSALKRYFEGAEQEPIIWFDMFSVSQHQSDNRPFDWWNTAFLTAVGSIGNVLMLMQPFGDAQTQTPAWTTLTRVWCVFELYACESTMGKFEVTMTKEMADRFHAEIRADVMSVVRTLRAIDCAQSTASKVEDRNSVFEVISKIIGFPMLNTIAIRVVERWIYSVLVTELAGADNESLISMLGIMRSIATTSLQSCVHRLGVNHAETEYLRKVLARIDRAHGNLEFRRELLAKGWMALEAEDRATTEKAMKLVAQEQIEQMEAKHDEMRLSLEAEERKALEEQRRMAKEAEDAERWRAEEELRKKAEERKALEEQRRRAEEEQRRRAKEAEEAAKRRAEEEQRRRAKEAEEAERRRAEEEVTAAAAGKDRPQKLYCCCVS